MFDGRYLIRAEVIAIVKAMAQAVLFLNGWGKDALARCVPTCTAAIYSHGGDLSCMYNCLAKIIIRHVAGGELQEVLVVQFSLCFVVAYESPVNISTMQ
jgi:hypothetical protein